MLHSPSTVPKPKFFHFPFRDWKGRDNITSNSLVVKTIVQGLSAFRVSAQDPFFASLDSQKNPRPLSRGKVSGPRVLESMLTFPDLVYPAFLPARLLVLALPSPEAAYFPLHVVLTGLSVMAWLILCSLPHASEVAPNLRQPHPEVIQAFPPYAWRTHITAISESKTNTQENRQHHLSFCHSWGLGFSVMRPNHFPFYFVENHLGCVCMCPKCPDVNRGRGKLLLCSSLSYSTETGNHGLTKWGRHRDSLKYFLLWWLLISSWGFILHYLPTGWHAQINHVDIFIYILI